MDKFIVLIIAVYSVNVIANPIEQKINPVIGESIRTSRAATFNPYYSNYHNPYGGHQHYSQHHDDIHCQPHYGHLDCHVDHYDNYGGGHGGHGGQNYYNGYGGYGSYGGYEHGGHHHHHHGPNPGQNSYSSTGNSHADASAKSLEIKTLLGGISYSDAESHAGNRRGLLGGLLK